MISKIIKSLKSGVGSHAYCFIGNDKTVQKNIDDIILKLDISIDEKWQPTENPVPINEVRQLVKWIHNKPLSGIYRLAVIPLDGLNQVSASALLKVLEEPPSHGLIITSASSSAQLLPTIKSRCQLVWLGTQEREPREKNQPDSLLNEFESIKDKLDQNSAGELIDQWLLELRQDLRDGRGADKIKQLLKLKDMSQSNINQKLLVENGLLIVRGSNGI